MDQATDYGSRQAELLGHITSAFAVRPCTDLSRRAAAQAIFAAIEGILWELECELLTLGDQELTAPERAFLRQDTQVFTENGKVFSKVCLKQRLVFTAVLVKRLRAECSASFDDSGWKSLLSSLDVRDRLLQPQDRADLDVTDAELKTALIGEAWFLDNIVAVVQTGLPSYREDNQRESALVLALSEWRAAGTTALRSAERAPNAVRATVTDLRLWRLRRAAS